MARTDICAFSGGSHRDLAEDICSRLGLALSPSLTRHVYNNNLHVQLQETVRERTVFIVQALCSPPVSDRISELPMMLDAARLASARRAATTVCLLAT
jgi:ribose-phosphate pyrophosphokinase